MRFRAVRSSINQPLDERPNVGTQAPGGQPTMLHFEGDRDFRQAPTDLWTKLSDARFLVQCIPGVETVKRAEPDLAVWTLRPNLGFVRGTLEVTLKVVEAVAEQSMRLLVQ